MASDAAGEQSGEGVPPPAPEGPAGRGQGQARREGRRGGEEATLAARTALATPVTAAKLFAGITQTHEPAMIAAFVADGAGGYVERSRGFIVPDDWPARAQAFARE